MSASRERLRELIRWVAQDSARWAQNAGIRGEATCAGCGQWGSVVYSNFLQWCEGCWPLVADASPDTQSKEWQQRRKEQEHSYGWVP